MANLVIGGSTYQSIDYVRIKKADGSTATFCDFARKDLRYQSASVSYKSGLAFALSAKTNLGKPTATIRKET